MLKKQVIPKLLIVLAIITIILSATQFISSVKANPFFNWQNANPDPATTPPKITVFSLQNGTVYSNFLVLNFNVTAPKLATAFNTGIALINYTLDNEASEVYSIYSGNSEVAGRQEFNYTQNYVLAAGNHNLTVNAVGFVNPNNLSVFYLDSTSTVNFVVVVSTPTIPPAAGNSYIGVPAIAIYAIAVVGVIAGFVFVIRRK